MNRPIVILLLLAAATACSGQNQGSSPSDTRGVQSQATVEIDSVRVVGDLRFLSSPELGGRATGSPGNAAARSYIEAAFTAAGVQPFPGGFSQPFDLETGGAQPRRGVNVVGLVPGTRRADRYIVVTAHYDHLGIRDDVVYPGADDNGSGTAALLELARYFAARPAMNSIVFAAFDAEEGGLWGARAFAANPPVPIEAIAVNVNMDMIGRNVSRELYVAGTSHYPQLSSVVDSVAVRSRLILLRGHDRQGVPTSDDWTQLSDHAAFHQAGIPFLYLGVEDHEDYHRPTDTFENIDPSFFLAAVRTTRDLVEELDRRLDEVEAATLNVEASSP